MDIYEIFSIYIIPSTLLLFGIDFLSDKQIVNNETLIGLLQLIHHLISTVVKIGGTTALFTKNIKILIISVIVFTISQIGWLMNNDYCWYTKIVNEIINPDFPRRKWISDLSLFIKKYIREEEWAYSEIRNNDKTRDVLTMNTIFIICIIRCIGF